MATTNNLHFLSYDNSKYRGLALVLAPTQESGILMLRSWLKGVDPEKDFYIEAARPTYELEEESDAAIIYAATYWKNVPINDLVKNGAIAYLIDEGDQEAALAAFEEVIKEDFNAKIMQKIAQLQAMIDELKEKLIG